MFSKKKYRLMVWIQMLKQTGTLIIAAIAHEVSVYSLARIQLDNFVAAFTSNFF